MGFVFHCPDPRWHWWQDFVRWCDQGRPRELRPKTLPKRIPTRAFDCYHRLHVKPQSDYGVFAGPGWFVRDPSGGDETEKIPAVKAADAKYLALNARDYDPAAWGIWRQLAAQVNLPCVPWGRVYDGPANAMTRTLVAEHTITYLGQVAQAWDAPGVALNIEDEIEHTITPERVAELSATFGDLAIVTDYRGYLDPTGTYHGPDWICLADRAVNIIEAFTNDDQIRDVGLCIERATQQGWKVIVPLLDTKIDPLHYKMQSAPMPVAAKYVLDIVAAADVAAWP